LLTPIDSGSGYNMAPSDHVTTPTNQQLGPSCPDYSKYTAMQCS